jgi:hypothetical protein
MKKNKGRISRSAIPLPFLMYFPVKLTAGHFILQRSASNAFPPAVKVSQIYGDRARINCRKRRFRKLK